MTLSKNAVKYLTIHKMELKLWIIILELHQGSVVFQILNLWWSKIFNQEVYNKEQLVRYFKVKQLHNYNHIKKKKNQKVFLQNMIKIMMMKMNVNNPINYKVNHKLLIMLPFKKSKKHQNIWKHTILI